PRNCPAPALPLMQTHTKGGEDGGTAHASGDGACQLSLACEVSEASHDKEQAEPLAQATRATLAQAGRARPTDEAGAPHSIPAPLASGSYREAAGAGRAPVGVDPYLAPERQRHQVAQAQAPETPTTATERMAANVRTPAGQAWYARRKVIVEAGFGPIQEARGFRRVLRRGWAKIRGEGRLVCLTHTLRKLWRCGGVLSVA
ncbi:MAG: transposase, partial [Anaerolineales bacterium]